MNERHENEEKSNLKRNTLFLVLSAVVLLAIAAVTLLLPASSTAPAELPRTQTVDSADTVKVGEGCELLQTLTYTRCEHVVTRRVTAPVELYGKTLNEVEALYPEWHITEFGAQLIKMEQQPDIYCPDHVVLMPNGAGVLCVFENKYGDALALKTELTLEMSSLPSAVQEDLQRGIGFSTIQELEQWLESVES